MDIEADSPESCLSQISLLHAVNPVLVCGTHTKHTWTQVHTGVMRMRLLDLVFDVPKLNIPNWIMFLSWFEHCALFLYKLIVVDTICLQSCFLRQSP